MSEEPVATPTFDEKVAADVHANRPRFVAIEEKLKHRSCHEFLSSLNSEQCAGDTFPLVFLKSVFAGDVELSSILPIGQLHTSRTRSPIPLPLPYINSPERCSIGWNKTKCFSGDHEQLAVRQIVHGRFDDRRLMA